MIFFSGSLEHHQVAAPLLHHAGNCEPQRNTDQRSELSVKFWENNDFYHRNVLIYDVYLAHYNLSLSKLEMNASHFSQTMTVSQIFAFYHLQNMVKNTYF